MLREALPLHLLQPIHPQPSTVRLKYSHYNQEFTLDVGGTLRFRTLDDRYALSFVFKGAFKVKLKELPKQQAGSNGSSAASRGMARGRDRFRSRPQEPVDGEGGEAASSRILSMDGDGYFHALRGGMSYEVLDEEDEEAEEAAKAAGEDGRPAPRLSAASLAAIQQQQQQSTGARPLAGRNDEGRSNADRLIKEELQNLSVNEIAERSERYRRLREAQDLQDVVWWRVNLKFIRMHSITLSILLLVVVLVVLAVAVFVCSYPWQPGRFGGGRRLGGGRDRGR